MNEVNNRGKNPGRDAKYGQDGLAIEWEEGWWCEEVWCRLTWGFEGGEGDKSRNGGLPHCIVSDGRGIRQREGAMGRVGKGNQSGGCGEWGGAKR